MRPRDHRSARKRLSAFVARELNQSHEHAMFLRAIARETLPPMHARRPAYLLVRLRPRTTRRRCRWNEDDLRAVECRRCSGERVPRILADENRGASPTRVERANSESMLDESFFVEEAVRGEKDLAVHVRDHGFVTAERDVDRAVEIRVFVQLVESRNHIDLSGAARA